MEFSLKKWFKKKPSNPTIYYLKQSEIAIYLTVMFLIFLIGFNWIQSPHKVVTTDNNIVVVVIILDLLGQALSEHLDKVIFGLYNFTFMSIKSSFGFLNMVFFWALPVFVLISMIFWAVACWVSKNKKLLLSFALYVIAILVGFMFFNVYAYLIFVLMGIVIHRVIAMGNYKILGNGEKV